MKANIRYLMIVGLMLSAWVFMRNHRDIPTPLAAPLSAFPTVAGEWRLVANTQFDQKTLDLLRPTDYAVMRYVRPDGAAADLYVGYHDGASQAGPLHSPKNCLPGSGWFEISSKQTNIITPDGILDTVVAVYQHGVSTELFIYWFQVGGASVSNEYFMKVREVLNSIRHGRRDAAFIRISVPVTGSKEHAAALAEDFLKSVHPALKQFLPS